MRKQAQRVISWVIALITANELSDRSIPFATPDFDNQLSLVAFAERVTESKYKNGVVSTKSLISD